MTASRKPPPAGRLTALLSCLFFMGLAIPAQAQVPPPCGPRPMVLEQLEEGFKELPSAMGNDMGGNIFELLTSPDGSTWTIIITDSRGRSCLAASGENWKPVTSQPKGRGA